MVIRNDDEEETSAWILSLNNELVALKKSVAALIGINKQMHERWRLAVRDVHDRGQAILALARRGDSATADALYEQRKKPFLISVDRSEECRLMRQAVESLKTTLRANNTTIELLKTRKNILIARRPGGGHAFASFAGLSEDLAKAEQAVARIPEPSSVDPNAELFALEVENKRLTDAVEAESNSTFGPLAPIQPRSWPAILARVGGG